MQVDRVWRAQRAAVTAVQLTPPERLVSLEAAAARGMAAPAALVIAAVALQAAAWDAAAMAEAAGRHTMLAMKVALVERAVALVERAGPQAFLALAAR